MAVSVMKMDIFGDDDGEPAPVLITGSPSENPSNSDNDNSPSSVKSKGTAPS